MTRFTDLAAKAVDHANRFWEQKSKCEQLAFHVATNVHRYLEAPDNATSFVQLHDDLSVKWESQSQPVLTQGLDGFWYFGLQIHFELPSRASYSKVVLKFGLRHLGERATVKLDETYSIIPGDATSWEPMLAEIVHGLTMQYSAPVGDSPKPIGFIQNAPQ